MDVAGPDTLTTVYVSSTGFWSGIWVHFNIAAALVAVAVAVLYVLRRRQRPDPRSPLPPPGSRSPTVSILLEVECD